MAMLQPVLLVLSSRKQTAVLPLLLSTLNDLQRVRSDAFMVAKVHENFSGYVHVSWLKWPTFQGPFLFLFFTVVKVQVNVRLNFQSLGQSIPESSPL
jgi:hypothetical protein